MKLSPVLFALLTTSSLIQASTPSPRIIGGTTAPANAWPWMASLLTAQNEFFCGGSLIGNRYVLTAAHCVESGIENQIQVQLGTQDLAKPGQRFAVEQIYLTRSYLNSDNFPEPDIALLLLKDPTSITPIQPDLDNQLQLGDGDNVNVVGWGSLDATPTTGSYPDQLQQVSLPLISRQSCLANGGFYSDLTDNMFCAGLPEGGKDSCFGDSGGPMMYRQGNQWWQVGIVSWGAGCAEPKNPGVYTNLASTGVSGWLKQQLQQGMVSELIVMPTRAPHGLSSARQLIHNASNQPLNIGALTVPDLNWLGVKSNLCTAQTLAPGEQCLIEFQFNPKQLGEFNTEVRLQVNGIDRVTKIHGLSGEGLSVALDWSSTWENQGTQPWANWEDAEAKNQSLAQADLTQQGDNAILTTKVTLTTDSILSFKYRWTSTQNSSFKLLINGIEQEAIPASSTLTSYALSIPKGQYSLSWELRQTGSGDSRAQLDQISLVEDDTPTPTPPTNPGTGGSLNSGGSSGGGSSGWLSLLLMALYGFSLRKGKA